MRYNAPGSTIEYVLVRWDRGKYIELLGTLAALVYISHRLTRITTASQCMQTACHTSDKVRYALWYAMCYSLRKYHAKLHLFLHDSV